MTSIEVLSLTNKTLGSEGRQKYLEKQQEILSGQVNLVEIDLLRGGAHSSAVPLWLAREKAGPFDYHVSVRHLTGPENSGVSHPPPAQAADHPNPLPAGDPSIPISRQPFSSAPTTRATIAAQYGTAKTRPIFH